MAPIFLVLVKYLCVIQGAYPQSEVSRIGKHSSLPMYGINCDRKMGGVADSVKHASLIECRFGISCMKFQSTGNQELIFSQNCY